MALADWNLEASEEEGQQEELRKEEAFLEDAKERRWQEIQNIAEELKREQEATAALHQIEMSVRFPWMFP